MSCGNCVNCSNVCDKCLACDNCDNCDSFTTSCDVEQTFCSGTQMKGQLAKAYIGAANAPTIKRDDIIIKVFPRKTLNNLIDYVSKAAKYGDSVTSGDWSTSHETRDFIYADKINQLLAGIRSLTSANSPGPNKSKNDIIYASDFQKIMSSINNLKLSPSACDYCDTQCDVDCNTCDTCDSCETCDTCISCNSCQSVTSYSSYYSSYYSNCSNCEETPSTGVK